MKGYPLDAGDLIALFNDENGAERAEAILE